MPRDKIGGIVSKATPSLMRPKAFFVSWQGVMTLVYSGFTQPLRKIKDELNETRNFPDLKPENQGARWPKTTLGAVQDGKRITPEQLQALKKICTEHDSKLGHEEPFKVESLKIVLFGCRSLERRIDEHVITLPGEVDTRPPEQEELDMVENILYPFQEENLDKYWVKVASDGNRCSGYRNTYVESTLVYDLPQPIPSYISEFKEEISNSRLLKDLYCWFDDANLHMTVRGLA